MSASDPTLHLSDPAIVQIGDRLADLEVTVRRLTNAIGKLEIMLRPGMRLQPHFVRSKHFGRPFISAINFAVCKQLNDGYDIPNTHQPGPFRLRQILIHIAREHGYSFPEIGRAIGRHHSTIVYAYAHFQEKQHLESAALESVRRLLKQMAAAA